MKRLCERKMADGIRAAVVLWLLVGVLGGCEAAGTDNLTGSVQGEAKEEAKLSDTVQEEASSEIPGVLPAVVWYAPGTQKIRPDVAAEEYADCRTDGLMIKTGRSEYESAQIIMSAEREIGSYELELSDLRLKENPSVVYPADQIQVFNQGYITVTTVMESSPLSTPGLYPDALIPFEAAREYGENRVEAGFSQGLWVTFYAPPGQRAGEYTGSFVLRMDGCEQEVPVSLKIWDIDFAENYTEKSCFLIDWTSFSYAELDSSQDMYDAYARALLEYRLQPELLMNDFVRSDPEDIAYYTEKAFELAQDPRCNVVFMPYELDNGRGDTYLVKEATKNWLRSFVDISLESFGSERQMNLVAKTMTYFTFIDEPTMNPYLIPRVNAAMETFDAIRREVQAEYREELDRTAGLSGEEYAFRLEVIEAIASVRNIVTGPHDDRMTGVEVYCPQVDEYDSAQNRAGYAQDQERWWYTAVGPRYPYPTYHIDDTNLLSARILSWIQADYDVAGNLYWATNLYNAYSAEEFIENPYDFAMRYTGAGGSNGDGFLFYPGKRYGVYGPLGSVRLHAIRDGLEEYETLRGIRQIYQEIDDALSNGDNPSAARVRFDDVYARMSENLYSGTSVYTTQAYFDEARELLGNLAELASMGGAVSSIRLDGDTAVIQLILPNDYTVAYEETERRVRTEEQPAEGWRLFTFSQPLQATGNTFACQVSDGDRTISLSLYLGGEIRTWLAAELTEGLSVGVREMMPVTEGDLTAAEVFEGASREERWLQLKLPRADAQMRHSLVIEKADLLSQIGARTQKLVLRIYNNRDATGADEGKYSYRLQFKYENNEYYTEIRQDTLKPGYNEITIGNLFGYAWEETGPLTGIRLFFGEPEGEPVEELYLIGLDVYSE